MSIFPAGYLNSHKDDADDAIDTEFHCSSVNFSVCNDNFTKQMFTVITNSSYNRMVAITAFDCT